MAVDGADIVEAQLFEERAAGDHAAGIFLGLARGFLDRPRKGLGHRLAEIAQGLIAAAGHQAGHIGAHPAHRRGDGHVVVVEHDGQLLGRFSRIVHGLIGHARAHGAVADDGHDAVVAAGLIAGRAEAQRRRDRGRGVGRAERVVFAFGPLGEARQTAALAQGADAVAPAGEDLVRIGLVADVPDQDVLGRLIDMVQRHRQLDHPQACAQMAAGLRDGVDGLGAELVSDLLELRHAIAADVGGRRDLIQQRCL